jgi:transcriptional regulator with XRE-family HTH domain
MLEKPLTNAQIGTIIGDYRKERQLTQEAFANELGVSLRTLVRWENGETEPNQLKVRAHLAKLIPQLAEEWELEAPTVEAPLGAVPPSAASGLARGLASVPDAAGLMNIVQQAFGWWTTQAAAGVVSAGAQPVPMTAHSSASTSSRTTDVVPAVGVSSAARKTITDGPGFLLETTPSVAPQPGSDVDEIRQDLSRLRQQFLQLKVELDESRLENSRQQMRIERLEMVLREHRLM